MFGCPIAGAANVYCDNRGVVTNTSVPESTLSKKHNSINYHVIRETVAAGIMRVAKENTLTNLADALTKLLPYSKKHDLMQCVLWDCWGAMWRFFISYQVFSSSAIHWHDGFCLWPFSISICLSSRASAQFVLHPSRGPFKYRHYSLLWVLHYWREKVSFPSTCVYNV